MCEGVARKDSWGRKIKREGQRRRYTAGKSDRRVQEERWRGQKKGVSKDGWMASKSLKSPCTTWSFNVPPQAGIRIIRYGSRGAMPALPLFET